LAFKLASAQCLSRFVEQIHRGDIGRLNATASVIEVRHKRPKIVNARQLMEDIDMTTRSITICAATVLGAMALASTSAQALTMKECSAKYKAAQAAGTAKDMKWNDFRKAECGSDAAATPAAATTTAPAAKPAATTAAKPMTPAAAKPAATGNAVFPNAVSPKYSKETAGKARMHTCLDQYNANKATNGNGGLNWIQKGGGYYSECNKQLKG
jgi:hypothetical protein